MNLPRLVCVLALALLFSLPDAALAQRRRQRAVAPPPPAVAQHVAILDGASGALLACEQCEEPVPPASMAKLMTVLIVLEQLQAGEITMETRFPVSEYAWREHGAMSSGSHMFLCTRSAARGRHRLGE